FHSASDGGRCAVSEREEGKERPSRLRRRARSQPLAPRLLVGVRKLAPSAVGVLMAPEPATCALMALRRKVLAGGGETREREPCAVDVVAAPPPIPRSVRLLPPLQELDGAPNGTARGRHVQARQGVEGATGDVVAARIDHGVVIGEGDESQHL